MNDLSENLVNHPNLFGMMGQVVLPLLRLGPKVQTAGQLSSLFEKYFEDQSHFPLRDK